VQKAAKAVFAPPTCKTIPAPTPAYVDDNDAAAKMAADAQAGGLALKISPPQTAAPKPALEIITMPMWLWAEVAIPCETTVLGADTITDQVVIDSVTWAQTGAITASVLCAPANNAVNRGVGIPYDTAYGNPAAPVIVYGPTDPRPCIVTSPQQPLYSTSTDAGGKKVITAGVVTLTATVAWHVDFTVTTAAGTTAPAPVPGSAATINNVAGPSYRVGEIQALVTQP